MSYRSLVERYHVTDFTMSEEEVLVPMHENAVPRRIEDTIDGLAIHCSLIGPPGATVQRRFRLMEIGGETFEPTGTAVYVDSIFDGSPRALFEVVGTTPSAEVTLWDQSINVNVGSITTGEQMPTNAEVLAIWVGSLEQFHVIYSVVGTPASDAARAFCQVGPTHVAATLREPHFLGWYRHIDDGLVCCFELSASLSNCDLHRYSLDLEAAALTQPYSATVGANVHLESATLKMNDGAATVVGWYDTSPGALGARSFRIVAPDQAFEPFGQLSQLQQAQNVPTYVERLALGDGTYSVWEV